MGLKVIKNGKQYDYEKRKIRNAIISAANQIMMPEFEKIDVIVDEIEDLIFTETEKSNKIEVEKIENFVMSVLFREMPEVARQYVDYKMEKERAYKNPNEIEKVLFVSPEIALENGNKNPELAHIKNAYLAEIPSKQFMREHLPKDCLEAHDRGVVYFHDASYSARPLFNCSKGDAWIDVRKTNNKETSRKLTIETFFNLIDATDEEKLINLNESGYQILAKDGWTKIKGINRRRLKEDEELYELRTRTGLPLKLTKYHRLPILRDGKELLLEVGKIKVGDSLLSFDDNKLLNYYEIKDSFINWEELNDDDVDLQITNLPVISNYIKYKYNLTLNYYIKNIKKMPIKGTIQNISLKTFLELLEQFPMPHEVLCKVLISAKSSKHKYPFLIPYSPQLAKLYGYIYSDGGVYINRRTGNYQTTFTNTNEKILDDFLDCFEEVFGRRLTKNYPTINSTSPCVRISCGDKLITKLFKEYASGKMKGSSDLRIPDFIMFGNEKIKYSYLAASIDSDGSISSQGIYLSSACKTYCEQIVLLLQSLGYTPTLRLTGKKGEKYHFGMSNRTGIRNFDIYKVVVNKNKEKEMLYNKMSTIKQIDTECYNTFSVYHSPHEIVAIKKYYEDCFVYDIQTESHWYNINNYFSHNCCLFNLEEIFKGCKINGIYIEPPKSFRTACTIATQALSHATNSQYGGITVNLLHLAKFVKVSREKIRLKYEKYSSVMSKAVINNLCNEELNKEISDGMQTFLYQNNTLCAGTGQAAFLSVSIWLNEDPAYTDDLILVFKEFIKQRIKGIRQENGTYLNPNFPKILYFLDEDNMKGGKYYDITKLCAECSAKRLVPDYLSVKVHRKLKGVPVPPMGCRSLLHEYINPETGQHELWGRWNLGVQSLNLPYIAMENNPEAKEEILFKNLEHYLDIAHRDMLWRANHIAKIRAGQSPLHWVYGGLTRLQPDETLEKEVYSGRPSISLGYAGLYECVKYITGESQFEENGNKLAHKILDFLNESNAKFKEETNLSAGLYGTPMETLVDNFAKACIRDFGHVGDHSNRTFITNSYHYLVSEKVDAFTKLTNEAQFSNKTTSGSISYVEVPNLSNNIGAMLELIEHIGNECLYAEVNSEVSSCGTCGFEGYDFKKILADDGTIRWKCPCCGETNPEKVHTSYRICGLTNSSH